MHILDLLARQKPELQRRFHVRDLAIFGSTARGEARPDSDLDVLVTFTHPPTFDDYTGLKSHLESMFESKIDLAIESDLRPAIRKSVEAEALHVP